MNDDKKTPFADIEIIDAYTRKQALEEGVLIDVSERAKEAGFRYPVAVTAALWSDINAIPASKSWQDVPGRLWDVLSMALLAIRSSKTGGSALTYPMVMPVGPNTCYTVKLLCGPGDEAEPVITLMCPEED